MKDSYKDKTTLNLSIYYYKYIILIIILFAIKYSTSSKKVEVISKKSHYIFTFWEPRNSLPGYLSLCLKTWKKYVPANYKVVILDYSNLLEYLGTKLIKQILCKDMALKIQADAIRVAILHKYGGFWMDIDTLIINSKFINIFSGSDLIMFGDSKHVYKPHIGFIYASSNSTILKAWLNIIIHNVKRYKYLLTLKQFFPIKYFKNLYHKSRHWSYIGNGILYKLLRNASEKEFKIIERDDALPDQLFLKGPPKKRYLKFYFSSVNTIPELRMCKGVLCLHNSWTPKKYKKMSKKKFLRQDIMLAHLISKVLYDTKFF